MSERITYRQLKPFCLPTSLDDLSGPHTGSLRLPIHLCWSPGDHVFDLARLGDALTVYQCVIAEGTTQEQHEYLNHALLIELWPHLHLDGSPVRYPPARHPTAEGQARCERASPTPHDHRRHATARNQRTGTPHSLVEESFSSERGTAIPSLGSHACIRNRRPTPTRRHHSNSQPFTLQTPTTPHRKTQRNPRRELNKMLRRGINATDLDHSARGAALSLRCVG